MTRPADSAAAIEAGLPTLVSDPNILAITATDAPVVVTAAQAIADQAALDLVSGGFTASDTAANLLASLPALAADSHVSSLVATNGAPFVSVDEALDYGAALGKLAGPFAIADPAAAIEAALPALAGQGEGLILALDTAVVATVAEFDADRAALDKIAGGFDISDSGAAVAADLGALSGDAGYAENINNINSPWRRRRDSNPR